MCVLIYVCMAVYEGTYRNICKHVGMYLVSSACGSTQANRCHGAIAGPEGTVPSFSPSAGEATLAVCVAGRAARAKRICLRYCVRMAHAMSLTCCATCCHHDGEFCLQRSRGAARTARNARQATFKSKPRRSARAWRPSGTSCTAAV